MVQNGYSSFWILWCFIRRKGFGKGRYTALSKNKTLVYFDHYLHEAGLHERFIEIIVSEFYDTMVLVLKKVGSIRDL